MNFIGLIISVVSFIVIGIFHPVVVKCEYFFGEKIWPVFLISGVICLCFSLMIQNTTGSSLLGVLGCSLLWSIPELKEQTKRVERGWFPKNPKRK